MSITLKGLLECRASLEEGNPWRHAWKGWLPSLLPDLSEASSSAVLFTLYCDAPSIQHSPGAIMWAKHWLTPLEPWAKTHLSLFYPFSFVFVTVAISLTGVGGKDGAGATEQVRHETTWEEHRPLSLATQIFPENFYLTQRSLLGFFQELMIHMQGLGHHRDTRRTREAFLIFIIKNISLYHS